MSDTYKLAIVVAVVLVGGIIGYYLIAGNESDQTDPDLPEVTANTPIDESAATPLSRPNPPVPADDADASGDTEDDKPRSSALYDLVAKYKSDRDNAQPSDDSDTPEPTADADKSDTTAEEPPTLTLDIPPADPAVNEARSETAPGPGSDDAPAPGAAASASADTTVRTPASTNTRSSSSTGARPGTTASSRTGSTTPPTRTTTSTPTRSTSASDTTNTRARTYTVREGDTLSSIAIAVFGTERRWVDIAQANPTIDPTRLQVDQVIKLPGRQEIEAADRVTQPAPGLVVEYIIRPNDNLSSIAQQYYGDPTRWRYIYNANRDKIGGNPDILTVGMKIEIPPVPDAAR